MLARKREEEKHRERGKEDHGNEEKFVSNEVNNKRKIP